jgi:hypothetical protein
MDSPSAPPPRGPLALRASLAQHSSVLVKSAPPPPPSFTHTHADLRFEVAARRSDSACTCRGIYLRDPQEARTPLTFHVDVSPRLHEAADTRSDRLEVEHKLLLKCTGEWREVWGALGGVRDGW